MKADEAALADAVVNQAVPDKVVAAAKVAEVADNGARLGSAEHLPFTR